MLVAPRQRCGIARFFLVTLARLVVPAATTRTWAGAGAAAPAGAGGTRDRSRWLHRTKPFWMVPAGGAAGADRAVPPETQMELPRYTQESGRRG